MLKRFSIVFLIFSILGCNVEEANSTLLEKTMIKNVFSNDRFNGKWVLSTYIGDKIFNDILELKTLNNNLEGSLTVPKVFSSKLEKIKLNNDLLTFEILVNEGSKPYRVAYECKIHVSNKQIIGFATNKEDNSLIGAFVGNRVKELK